MNPQETVFKEREILVAEDSPTQAERLRHLLESRGYTVTVATNGRIALQAAEQHKPSLIITDVVMPDMNGIELCREVRSRESLRSTPVILVTSLGSVQDILDALANGADNFIRKPYDETYLMSRVEYLLSGKKAREDKKAQVGVQLNIRGQRHFITAERQQIADLLISTYDEALRLNEDLQALTQRLEEKVEERTAELQEEVAERQRAEEDARTRETQLRLIVDAAKDYAIFMLDPSGRVASWPGGAERLFGYRAEEAMGMPISSFYPREAVEHGEPEEDLKAAGEDKHEKEAVLRRKDGSLFWADIAMSALREGSGKVRGFSLVVRDITERRREEREREFHSLEGFSPPPGTSETARIYGERPLREAAPSAFQAAVHSYVALLEQAVERRIHKSADPPSDSLRGMVQELGFLRAAPRDMVEIHIAALKIKVNGVSEGKEQAYLEEGRLVALEMMGRLASFYRSYYQVRGYTS